MTQRILVDLLGYTGTRGGTETYVRELLPLLAARMPDADFVGLVNREGRARVAPFFPGPLRTVRWVGGDRVSWAAGELAAVEHAARKERAELVWSPANFGPVVRGTPRVATVHDVIYHEVAGGPRDRAVRSITSRLMTGSARTADAVITVSHAAKAAIALHMGVSADKIHVVHNGSSTPRPAADPRALLSGVVPSFQRPIILSTGNRMPHKNFDGLLRAIAAMDPADRPLTVIPGSHGDDPLSRTVAGLELERDVILPGWVTGEQLEALYQVAALYVCPSLAEGFGLPVVDALKRGCAVVANDIPVLREVGGEAARYADARDASAFAAAIAGALVDPSGSTRRTAGIAWAEQFTWEATAAGTARILSGPAGRPGAR